MPDSYWFTTDGVRDMCVHACVRAGGRAGGWADGEVRFGAGRVVFVVVVVWSRVASCGGLRALFHAAVGARGRKSSFQQHHRDHAPV